MARSYAKISITLWQSRKFRATRDDVDARLLYFYLHSCPQVNGVGCYSLPIGYVATDLGWDEPRILASLEALEDAGLIEWDPAESMVRIVGFLEHDPPTNPKHASAMVTTLRSVHDGRLKLSVVLELLANKHCATNTDLLALKDTLSIGYGEGICLSLPSPSPVPNPSLREEGAQCTPSKPKRERKTKFPLPDDCPNEADRNAAVKFWQERGRGDLCARLGDEAEAFRAHHLAHGKRMENWGSAWRTWYGNAMRFQQKPRVFGAATGATEGFTNTDERGWRDRVSTLQRTGNWLEKWGPKPGEPGCKCPPHILDDGKEAA